MASSTATSSSFVAAIPKISSAISSSRCEARRLMGGFLAFSVGTFLTSTRITAKSSDALIPVHRERETHRSGVTSLSSPGHLATIACNKSLMRDCDKPSCLARLASSSASAPFGNLQNCHKLVFKSPSTYGAIWSGYFAKALMHVPIGGGVASCVFNSGINALHALTNAARAPELKFLPKASQMRSRRPQAVPIHVDSLFSEVASAPMCSHKAATANKANSAGASSAEETSLACCNASSDNSNNSESVPGKVRSSARIRWYTASQAT
mmetsp:Transcript_116635/g.182291  ORF Transcript_116635/g.182291 Transcript_116635/m.182291 type:complete len:267 (+) Transcript_116635:2604-3404(+)